jgi:hypothetical protein
LAPDIQAEIDLLIPLISEKPDFSAIHDPKNQDCSIPSLRSGLPELFQSGTRRRQVP